MRTGLVERCRAAADATEPSLEQLHLLISQQIDLGDYLPAALDILAQNPLVEAGHFPGDLLKAVLSVDPSYWSSHAESWSEVHSILGTLDSALANVHDARATFMAMK